MNACDLRTAEAWHKLVAGIRDVARLMASQQPFDIAMAHLALEAHPCTGVAFRMPALFSLPATFDGNKSKDAFTALLRCVACAGVGVGCILVSEARVLQVEVGARRADYAADLADEPGSIQVMLVQSEHREFGSQCSVAPISVNGAERSVGEWLIDDDGLMAGRFTRIIAPSWQQDPSVVSMARMVLAAKGLAWDEMLDEAPGA